MLLRREVNISIFKAFENKLLLSTNEIRDSSKQNIDALALRIDKLEMVLMKVLEKVDSIQSDIQEIKENLS